MKCKLILLVLLLAAAFLPVHATPFEIVTAKHKVSIVYTKSPNKLDSILAYLLANDIRLVTGYLPRVYTDVSKVKGNVIIISSQKGNLECYSLKLINHALVIAGSDARGTAYGVFDISERIGVSPWYWWADVTPPEFMGWSQTEPTTPVSRSAYNPGEAQRRIESYDSLETAVKHMNIKTDAFYELVYYPVVCASLMNKKFLYPSKLAYAEIEKETAYYNDSLAGGKWKNIMSMKPRNLPVFQEPPFKEEIIPADTSHMTTRTHELGDYTGFVEKNGIVSMRAVNFTESAFSSAARWQVLDDLQMLQSPLATDSPYVAYEFYSFTTAAPVVNVYTLPTHPLNKSFSMRYAVSIDEGPLSVVDFKNCWQERGVEAECFKEQCYQENSLAKDRPWQAYAENILHRSRRYVR